MKNKHTTILLDDFLSDSKLTTSRVYSNPQKEIVAHSFAEVEATLFEIENSLKDGLFVVVVFSYELGKYFVDNFKNDDLHYQRKFSLPIISAWAFKNLKKLAKQDVDEWLKREKDEELTETVVNSNGSGICNLKMSLNEENYSKQINKILEKITMGDTYQVNFTFKIFAEFYGSVVDLYMKLRERQPSRYGALIRCHERQLLSFSPECFVELEGDKLKAKPMKGTLSARESLPLDLAEDEKNRAENLMIVDLLRNDLGRISKVGTVNVPKLFDVERVGEIYQMTSSIESKIKKNIGLFELLQSTFPCGSITGTPKKKTMQIIEELETSERGVYCGSIGWFDPIKKSSEKLGNLMMNVSIRTAEILGHRVTFGVGSGVTIDSNSSDEWKECLLKASFLSRLPSGVGLFETIKIEGNKPRFLNLHVNRLMQSADKFGIFCDRDQLEDMVLREISEVCKNKEKNYKLKINLYPDSKIKVEVSSISKLKDFPRIFWASDLVGKKLGVIDSQDPLYKHKTTNRKIYDLVWKKAEQLGGFDGIFTNENGFLTEGGRTNIFIKRGDSWFTPHEKSGLLPGIMRSVLIKEKFRSVQETFLKPKDLFDADEVYLCNSLRGLIRVNTISLKKINKLPRANSY